MKTLRLPLMLHCLYATHKNSLTNSPSSQYIFRLFYFLTLHYIARTPAGHSHCATVLLFKERKCSVNPGSFILISLKQAALLTMQNKASGVVPFPITGRLLCGWDKIRNKDGKALFKTPLRNLRHLHLIEGI